MFTDDPVWIVVGVDRTLRALIRVRIRNPMERSHYRTSSQGVRTNSRETIDFLVYNPLCLGQRKRQLMDLNVALGTR